MADLRLRWHRQDTPRQPPWSRGRSWSFLEERVVVAACLAVLIVLLADVFHDLVAGRLQPRRERDGERLRVIHRILDRHRVHERPHIRARPSLDRVELFAVRRAFAVEPELVVEANRVDDERVLVFPAADRMTEPGWIELRRMLPAVHEDLTEAVDVPFMDDEQMRRRPAAGDV